MPDTINFSAFTVVLPTLASLSVTGSALAGKHTLPAYDASHANYEIAPYGVLFGSAGTLVGVTASTTNGLTAITLSAGHGITNGKFITIAGVNHAFVVSGVGATSATLNRPATATVAGAAVQYIQRVDPYLSIGYNDNRVNFPSEPEFVSHWETDYLDTDGYRKMEYYLQYTSGDGLTTFRPFFFQINRDLKRLEYSWIEVGAQALYIQDTNAVVLASFTLTSTSIQQPTTFAAAVTIGGLLNASANLSHLLGAAGAGSASTALILNAQTTSGVSSVQMKGAGSLLLWQKNSVDAFQQYMNAGDANLYLRDLVNARMQVTFTPGASATAAVTIINSSVQIAGNLGFYGAATAAKPTVTGSRGANAALASFLTGLAGLGLITDSTTV